MKEKDLLSEPSKREVVKQSLITYANSYQLLINLRCYCRLNKSQGALLLGIDKSMLRRYENRRQDMMLQNFCTYISAYRLYATSNNIALPEDIEIICHFFIDRCTESKQE